MAEVTIYCKPSCPYCAAAKAHLEKHGVQYEEIDVTVDAEALAEMERLSGGRQVPVIVRGTEVTVGFGGA